MPAIPMKQLLEAGVHFGHQTKRWNPKMKPYIFGARNGIYIIDLQKTVTLFDEAFNFIADTVAGGGSVLFVGTKRQAQDSILEEATRAGQFYVNQRWLGGTMTNWKTIRQSVDRMHALQKMEEDGTLEQRPKKERLSLRRARAKLEKNLMGISQMNKLPEAIFIVDVRKERIALKEANNLKIPVVAIVDTNCDPEDVDYIIPGNDDAIRAIRLFSLKIADACIEGADRREKELADEEEDASYSPPDAAAAEPERQDQDEADEAGETSDEIGAEETETEAPEETEASEEPKAEPPEEESK